MGPIVLAFREARFFASLGAAGIARAIPGLLYQGSHRVFVVEAPGIETPAESGDPQGSRRFPDETGAASVPTTAAKCAKPRQADESQTKPADPRTVLLGQLAEGMRAALAAGDVEAARIAHETIGRLLGAPRADAAGVIDLAAERSRRGG
ncbi:hypothetical protein WME90_40705 [Sorangium sp. So ce375]|uniref:hypothetical protein n=1 Tax=Sorangium sp. So ce375 TaxID=3133306 RepID=UPI003F5CAF7C